MTRVKICGITDERDAALCADGRRGRARLRRRVPAAGSRGRSTARRPRRSMRCCRRSSPASRSSAATRRPLSGSPRRRRRTSSQLHLDEDRGDGRAPCRPGSREPARGSSRRSASRRPGETPPPAAEVVERARRFLDRGRRRDPARLEDGRPAGGHGRRRSTGRWRAPSRRRSMRRCPRGRAHARERRRRDPRCPPDAVDVIQLEDASTGSCPSASTRSSPLPARSVRPARVSRGSRVPSAAPAP